HDDVRMRGVEGVGELLHHLILGRGLCMPPLDRDRPGRTAPRRRGRVRSRRSSACGYREGQRRDRRQRYSLHVGLLVSSALAAAGHPLTAPVIACTNRRWPMRNTSSTGTVVKTVPAITCDQWVMCSPWNVVRPTCTVNVRLDVIAISGQNRSFH